MPAVFGRQIYFSQEMPAVLDLFWHNKKEARLKNIAELMFRLKDQGG